MSEISTIATPQSGILSDDRRSNFFTLRRGIDNYLLCGAIYLVANLMGDIQSSGHPWRQGDWLIHNEAGTIRR